MGIPHWTAAARMACAAAMLTAAGCASAPAPATSATRPVSGTPAPKPAQASSAFKPDAMLSLCPSLTVSNAPATQANRQITGYKPFVTVHDAVTVAIAPVSGACLTSAFGPRGGGKHKGIDLQVKPASMIHAAAAGVILEAEFRPDYGWQVVIDHGSGVFTRYAHLTKFEEGVTAGVAAPFGMKLGVMGNTAAYAIPVHLHYEVLVGNYATPKKSFGLTPINVFSLGFVDR